MRTFGIDISKWQGNFNFNAAKKEGVSFTILKGGGGDNGLYKDSKFEQNYTNAKQHNLPVGVYWFSKATTLEEAIDEAEYFYKNILLDKQFELPVFIDVEHGQMLSLGKELLTSIVEKWCSYLENKGFWVGIYSSVHYFSKYMDDEVLKKYTHWVAQWAEECTYKNTATLGFWQFGGETNLLRSNIVADVICDQNYMYKDFPTLIKEKKLNGFNNLKNNEKHTNFKKTNEQIAKEVISGLWGNGVERKTRLTNSGYNYTDIQMLVNKMMNSDSNTPTLKSGDLVKMLPEGVVFETNKKFAPFVYNSLLYLRGLKNNRAVISIQPEGAITGAVDVKYLVKVKI